MTYKEITDEVSRKLNLSPDVVKYVYNLYWKFIKTTIEELPLKDDLTEEEFNQLKKNFNLPFLGKLHCSYDRWKRIKKQYSYAKDKRN